MLVRFLANAAAIAVATFLIPGISVTGETWVDQTLAVLAVSIIFGVVNSIIKPLFAFVTAPLILMTLGLFLLIINALLLLLVSWAAGLLGLGWHVDGLWSAFWGGLIVSIVSFVLNAFFGKRGEDHR